jgi:hypothetical protein
VYEEIEGEKEKKKWNEQKITDSHTISCVSMCVAEKRRDDDDERITQHLMKKFCIIFFFVLNQHREKKFMKRFFFVFSVLLSQFLFPDECYTHSFKGFFLSFSVVATIG